MTQILRAETDADFLAMVPHIAGFTAHESLVVVMLREGRTCGAFRIDLPKRQRTADSRELAGAVVELLKRARGVDLIVPVIYTDATFEAEHGIPRKSFAEDLGERIHRAGFHLNGYFCVAGDGWGSYFDEELPREGHPLAELDDNATVASIANTRHDDLVDVREIGRLPQRDAEATAAFFAALAPLLDLRCPDRDMTKVLAGVHARADRLAPYGADDPVSWVELCAGFDGDVPIEVLAHLVALAQSASDRDTMMMQFAFGRIVGEAVDAENERLNDLRYERGGTMDDLVASELAAGLLSHDDEFMGLLWGRGSLRPDVDRVKKAIGMLSFAAANVPDFLRTPPLCMIAWLTWTLGLSTAAGSLAKAALEIDPQYGMAHVLLGMLSQGHVPDWAFVPDHEKHE